MARLHITRERAEQLLSYDRSTGVLTWVGRSSSNSRVRLGSIAGNLDSDGYLRICIDRQILRAHRLAWLLVHGVMPEFIDHINGDRSDNRLENLREADITLNNQNRRGNKAAAYGDGIVKSRKGTFAVRIGITLLGRKLQVYLGSYETIEEARAIREAGKALMHPTPAKPLAAL